MKNWSVHRDRRQTAGSQGLEWEGLRVTVYGVVAQHFEWTKCPAVFILYWSISGYVKLASVENHMHFGFLSPDRSEEANKAFSAAVQMHDVLVKAWAMWGDYLENIFVKERQLHLGVSAITCYLHACRHQNESKSRKYLAKVRPKK